MTTIWDSARPVPALLTAVHSYVPSSALEACGISQLLFPDSLSTHNSWRYTITLTPLRVPQPHRALRGLTVPNPAQRGGPKSSWSLGKKRQAAKDMQFHVMLCDSEQVPSPL